MPVSFVHLTSRNCSLLLAIPECQLPVVVHWGAALGPVDHALAVQMWRAAAPPVVPNGMDIPPLISVIPEQYNGWTGRPGLVGSHRGRNWAARPRTVSARLDGVDVPEGGVAGDAAGTLVVEAADEGRLRLELVIEMLESSLVRVRCTVRNDDAGEYGLEALRVALPVPDQATEVMDFAGRWSKERVPQRGPLRIGSHERVNRRGRTGPDSPLVLTAGEAGFRFRAGETWGVHVAHSGNQEYFADSAVAGLSLIGGGEHLLPGEMLLGAGEAYESPDVYFAYANGLDEQAGLFHERVRRLGRLAGRPRPVTLNVWEAVYFDHRLERLVEVAELAAGIGVERYVLDDGWFNGRRDDTAGLGDWFVDPGTWPGGLTPLIERVRGLGMEFGLWIEPEMVNLDSDLAREHPEWIFGSPDRVHIASRNQHVLDLTQEDAYAHIRDRIFALLTENEISYIKWDHNRDLVDASSSITGRPRVHAQTEAFYRLVDEVRARFPHVEIESCSSGGGRIDLGVLARTDRVWGSDCNDPLERVSVNRWTKQLVPPEYLGSHVASPRSHTTGRRHELGFRAAVSLLAHMGVEWDLTQASRPELDELSEWIALHKRHRSLVHSGTVVRADLSDPSLALDGVVSPDRAEGLFVLQYVDRSPFSPMGRIRLPGLDPNRRYRLTAVTSSGHAVELGDRSWWTFGPLPGARHLVATEGVVLTGTALAVSGIRVPDSFPERAVVLHVRAEPV